MTPRERRQQQERLRRARENPVTYGLPQAAGMWMQYQRQQEELRQQQRDQALGPSLGDALGDTARGPLDVPSGAFQHPAMAALGGLASDLGDVVPGMFSLSGHADSIGQGLGAVEQGAGDFARRMGDMQQMIGESSASPMLKDIAGLSAGIGEFGGGLLSGALGGGRGAVRAADQYVTGQQPVQAPLPPQEPVAYDPSGFAALGGLTGPEGEPGRVPPQAEAPQFSPQADVERRAPTEQTGRAFAEARASLQASMDEGDTMDFTKLEDLISTLAPEDLTDEVRAEIRRDAVLAALAGAASRIGDNTPTGAMLLQLGLGMVGGVAAGGREERAREAELRQEEREQTGRVIDLEMLRSQRADYQQDRRDRLRGRMDELGLAEAQQDSDNWFRNQQLSQADQRLAMDSYGQQAQIEIARMELQDRREAREISQTLTQFDRNNQPLGIQWQQNQSLAAGSVGRRLSRAAQVAQQRGADPLEVSFRVGLSAVVESQPLWANTGLVPESVQTRAFELAARAAPGQQPDDMTPFLQLALQEATGNFTPQQKEQWLQALEDSLRLYR